MVLKWLAGRLKAADDTGARLERARALRLRDEFDVARQACVEILRDAPEHAGAMALLAAIAADQQHIEAGLEWARRALGADAGCVPAHFAMGRLLQAAERYDEAEASYRRVTELDPANAQAQTNLGCMLHLQGRIGEAVACYRRALQLEPGQPEALRNFSLVAGGPEEIAEALAGFERHVASHPGDAAAQQQLGHLYVQVGRHDEALAAYERALALDPQRPEFHFAMGQLLLLLGRYAEGWREYAWRWRMQLLNAAMVRFPQPPWDGAALPQGTLLLHGESAFGDTLQFVRHAAQAAERCARVVVECPAPLQALVASVPGVAQAVPEGTPLPHFDDHLPLIACPGLFGITPEAMDWRGPYMHADAALVRAWEERVAASQPRPRKVGLVWTGNPANPGNRERSVSLQQLGRLAEAAEVSFFNLQKGGPEVQPGPIPPGMHFVDLTAGIRDFSDTAALLAHLDLVISIDRSVAHLAGAMGRPVWVLLPFSADWRYHVGRDDNPWYPSMRLFRQESQGDWSAPLERLRLALLEWAAR